MPRWATLRVLGERVPDYFCARANPFAEPPNVSVAVKQTERSRSDARSDSFRYRAKPEKAEENQRLVEGVFRELQAKAPPRSRYLVLRLADGTFCHLVDDDARVVANLDAFAAFRRGGEERRLDEAQQLDATVIGNYRMLGEP